MQAERKRKKKENPMHIRERPAWWVTGNKIDTINQMLYIRLSGAGFLRIALDLGTKCQE
jgi:hypothetical protein